MLSEKFDSNSSPDFLDRAVNSSLRTKDQHGTFVSNHHEVSAPKFSSYGGSTRLENSIEIEEGVVDKIELYSNSTNSGTRMLVRKK